MPDPTYYRRHLPHRQPTDGVFNIVVRLDGSLPKEVIEALKDAHAIPLKELEHENLDPAEREAAIRAEKAFILGNLTTFLTTTLLAHIG